jgi:2-dehydropantoate 2-reductase
MQTKTFDEQVPVAASTEMSALQGAQLILFCVKSTDTESAALQALPYLAPHAVVLSLQNGVDNGDRLRRLLPDQVVASAVVYVATEMADPGHVKHHGRGELVMEPFTGSSAVTTALVEAGVPAEVFDNVRGALWLKLIINCVYNAISAIAQLPYGKTAIGEGVQAVMRDAVNECLAVAKAEGVVVAGDTDAAVRLIFDTMPGQFSSTAQDLARGKPSEIDYLNGFIVRRGEAHGIATPVNRTLWSLVKLLESKQR